MNTRKFAAIKPECYNDSRFTFNPETLDLKEYPWDLGTVWPFEVTEDNKVSYNGNEYYKVYGTLVPESAVYYVSEEEYKELIFDRESAGDENMVRDIDLKYNQDPKALGEELIKAFCNKIYNYKSEWAPKYCDFIDKCTRGVARSEISVMWADYDEENKEIKIHVSLGKPGYFIGRCGEIVDFWTARIKNILKYYNPEFKFSFRLQEYAQIEYRESKIRM